VEHSTTPATAGLSEPVGRRRSHSHVTLHVEVNHDGDPHVLGEHLCVEIYALLDRWGHNCDSAVVDQAEVVLPGDNLSPHLPAIGHVSERGRP
jgi:hypothetical protein